MGKPSEAGGGVSPHEWVTVVTAVLALMVSLYGTWRSETRLNDLEEVQYASRVFLSEAPHYAAVEHPENPWWVVVNASAIQVHDVWVMGVHKEGQTERPGRVIIWSVQPCSLYALPENFEPREVHFEDPHGRWVRDQYGELAKEGRALPERDTGDSPWWMDAENCAA